MKIPARLLTGHGKAARQMFAAILKRNMWLRKRILFMTINLPSNFETRLLQETLILLQANNKGAGQTSYHRSQNSAFVC